MRLKFYAGEDADDGTFDEAGWEYLGSTYVSDSSSYKHAMTYVADAIERGLDEVVDVKDQEDDDTVRFYARRSAPVFDKKSLQDRVFALAKEARESLSGADVTDGTRRELDEMLKFIEQQAYNFASELEEVEAAVKKFKF